MDIDSIDEANLQGPPTEIYIEARDNSQFPWPHHIIIERSLLIDFRDYAKPTMFLPPMSPSDIFY
jgi:hypothetical protein